MSERYAEIDAWKGIGILVVVLIHSMRPPWDPRIAPEEIWLAHMTRFGVPAFCAASGFLYASASAVGRARTLARVRRVLLPYLVASLAAQVFWALMGVGPQRGALWKDLLFAASFGPYYYVWVALVFVLLTPLFSRLGDAAIAVCLLVTFPIQGMFESRLLFDLFWHIRNPLLWLPYFLAGWWIRQHYDVVSGVVRRRRGALVAGFGLALVADGSIAALAPKWPYVQLIAWLGIWAILGLLFCAFCGRARVASPIRQLSDLSYPIYLFHIFAVEPLQVALQRTRGELEIAALLLTWAVGIALGLGVVAASRAALGPERSREWIGA